MGIAHALGCLVASVALILGMASAVSAAEVETAKAAVMGSIRNNAGVPVCGLVLANGVFTFSCSPTGSYSLANVPLDGNGQITLFGFAEGHFPFKTILAGAGGNFDITLNIASAAPPPPQDNNRTRTERLVGGTWSVTYVIISSFSHRYSFSSVQASTATPGDYNAIGADEFGNSVIGTYSTRLGNWAILDPGTLIDRFYVFTFDDNNRISGCYHQVNPAGSTNLGRCYAMTGSRFPPKAFGPSSGIDTSVQEASEAMNAHPQDSDPDVVEAYLRARKQLNTH